MKTKEIKFTWETIDLAVESLKYVIEPLKPSHIIGIGRGGFIPAVILSHRMKIPMHPIMSETYIGARRTPNKRSILSTPQNVHELMSERRCLVIDDVIDSASTFNAVRAQYPLIPFAALVSKRPLINAMHFCYVPQDVWVKFPWE